jgi:transcription elongation factor GreA
MEETEYREEREDDIVLTRSGYEKLQEELDNLKNVKRWEVAKRLEHARAFGDITENSEYEDAKQEQAFLAGRILDIERTLDNARIIKEEELDSGSVNLGSLVILRDLEHKEDLTFRVVSSPEARGSRECISDQSPVGKAILNRKTGETVEVTAPSGVLRFKILKIEK